MDKFLRFSDYDIFGYLIAGLASFGLFDLFTNHQIVLQSSWTVSSAVITIVAAYIAGHLISGLATALIDRGLVRRFFGKPDSLLFSSPKKSRLNTLKKWLFGEFFDPLPGDIRDRVLKRAKLTSAQNKGKKVGEILFYRAWPYIKREPIAYSRLETFLKLYHFHRTISFLSLISAVAIPVSIYFKTTNFYFIQDHPVISVIFALIIAYGMFRRYLRFFRLYSVEVFSNYSEPLN
jgi:hypothetical protein